MIKPHRISNTINHQPRADSSQSSVQPSVLCVTRVAVMVLMLECNPFTPGSSAVPVDLGYSMNTGKYEPSNESM